MSSATPFVRSAPTSFRLGLPTTGSEMVDIPTGTLKLTLGPTDSAGPEASQPLFSGAGGAAIVIVFVACSLLVGSLITAFTLRKVRERRRGQSPGASWEDVDGDGRPPSPKFGAKPEMCDMHLPSFRWCAHRSSGLWENMQVSNRSP